MAARIAAMSPAQRELLALHLSRQQRAVVGPPAIPRRTGSGPAPLSLYQERLWLLDQMHPGSEVYNVFQAVRLVGPLDVPSLRKAMDLLVVRHESLRTTIRSDDGRPMQVIRPPGEFCLSVISIDDMPEEHRLLQAHRLATEEAHRPFDLARGPLFRARLIHLADLDHILAITMHHVISDGWSMAVFSMELSYLYRTLIAGGQPLLPELPIQYVDYALWQRSLVEGEQMGRQLYYWKEQLKDYRCDIELPFDRPRPAVPTFSGAEHREVWPLALSASLAALGRGAGATTFMTFLAALGVLLYRYTGQEDIVVSSPIADRKMLETESVIGFFVNILTMRMRVDGDVHFLQLLSQVRGTALAAYENSDVPFDRLVADVQGGRSRGRTPLANVLMSYQKASDSYLAFPELDVTPLPIPTRTAKADLSFELLETPSGLTVRVEYSTDVLAAETVARMLGHYRVLLEGIAAEPHCTIGCLPLLTEPQRRRAVVEWNDTDGDYLRAPCVSRLFEIVASGLPDAVAVVDGQRQWTYTQVNAHANRLARRLQALGVGPGIMVGVCLERSIEAVVAFLAIIKAGGAYVPLYHRDPTARLAHMLDDTRAPVVLTIDRLRASLPPTEATVLALDADADTFAVGTESNLPISAGPEDPACVIYTSGTTGRPKGVVVPHRAILRLVVGANYVALGPDDAVAHASNLAFDAATFEIWGPLLNGARSVVLQTNVLLSPRDLADEIRGRGITTLFLTTAMFNRIVEEYPQAFGDLQCLLFGGEASDPGAVAGALREAPQRRLIHVYGPTEATTFSTWHPVTRVADGASTVPIGRAIANTSVFLLDKHRNPVPVGVRGELYIGGPGLSMGYLNDPVLTARKFVSVSFGGEPKRLFRTGDMGRYLPDGSIEWLGRLDDQVKIRGFRVEPAEIEAVLRSHPGIRDAAVIVREDVPGQQRLVAYVTAEGAAGCSQDQLRAALGQQLPAYMIPSAVVSMAGGLPLTPNGKVDRLALPAPESGAAVGSPSLRGPKGFLEARLEEIWRDVLGIARIGMNENFFEDLGGHSLLAVRLFARIEKTLGMRLPIAVLFEAPTVEKLAAALGCAQGSEFRLPVVSLCTEGRGLPFFCVTPMDAFGVLHLARHMGADRPFHVLQPLGCVDMEKPEIDIPALARRYLAEVRSIQPKGPYLLSGHSVGGTIAYEMAHQLQSQGDTVAALVLFDSWCPTHGWTRRINQLVNWHILRYVRTFHRCKPGDRARYVLGLLSPSRWRNRHGAAGRADDAEPDPIGACWRKLHAAYRRGVACYVPAPYAGRPVLFRCAKESTRLFDTRMIWRKLASEGIDVYHVSGDHVTMMQEPHVEAMAKTLRQILS